MGFLYNQPGPVSTITPPAKDVRTKAFQVARTDSAGTVKAWLPANSSILEAVAYITTTTDVAATVSVGAGSTTNNVINALTLTVATVFRSVIPTVLALGTNEQPGQDIPINITVAPGTSTVGGPVTVVINYCN